MTANRPRYNTTVTTGLVLFALSLPLSKSAGNILLFLIYLFVIAGVLLYRDVKESVVSSIKQPLTPAFFSIYFVALAGVFLSEKYAAGLKATNLFLSLPAIYLMVSVLIDAVPDGDKRYRFAEALLAAFLIGLLFLNLIGVLTYLGIVGNKKFVLPLQPMHVHHIWFSNINALGLYTAAAFLLFSRRTLTTRTKWFLFVFIALAVLGVLLSTSRTAWFGIMLTSVIMAFLVKKSWKIFLITALGTAAAGITAYLTIPFVNDRIRAIVSDLSNFSAGVTATSIGERFLMWKAAIRMFLSNPLMGVGTGNYVPAMTAYVSAGRFPEVLLQYNQPHNIYFFALATNGLLGLAALLYLFYRVFTLALPVLWQGEGNRERLFAFIAVATAIHYMIAGLTDSFFNIQILRYAFIFMMGVCVRKSITPDRSS
ncbi:MAG: O-antigen ligase family protein [Nitrospiraceae bacterium]|nr:O-antigen ligase family protein [Nitrospiraceae bacterium]